MFAVLLILFFGSGINGLIYELVWLRYLSPIFGVTIYAVSTVLSAFMGGLALGGYLAGRVAGRVKRPLRAYGLMAIGIGLSAQAATRALLGRSGSDTSGDRSCPSPAATQTTAHGPRYAATSASSYSGDACTQWRRMGMCPDPMKRRIRSSGR